MSKRLPEDEVEFRLLDPITEEYRLMLLAYKQMFVDAILTQWVLENRPGTNLGDELAKRIGYTLINCNDHGAFTAEYGSHVPDEILDAICREWKLGDTFQQFLEGDLAHRMAQEDDPELPEVFRKALK